MPKSESRVQILSRHFFRRFFDNDTISTEGETETTIVRALCTIAVPPLMAAFWLLPSYAHRSNWALASDRYLFVLYPFIVMGLVTTVEWEMLFPDRSDFQILLPLGLREWEMFWAKGKALLKFLAMFLIAANFFATVIFSTGSTPRHALVWRTMAIHATAATASGIFAAFALIAIGGITVCIIPPRWFRRVSTLVQTITVAALVTIFLPYPFFASRMPMLLNSTAGLSPWLPPVWFLGLYEQMLYGRSAPAASATLATLAEWALIISVIAAVAVYPLAWARQRKRAMEGDGKAPQQGNPSLLRPLLHHLMKMPQQRAVFHFVFQTITRSQRYQLYLAFYAGVGLALACCCSLVLEQHGGVLQLGISSTGVRAALPLLLFWMAMGLRTAFAFPVDMRARWIFPMSLKASEEGDLTRSARAAQLWLLLVQLTLIALYPAVLLAAGLGWWPTLLESAYALIVTLLLSAALFVGRTQIPFTRPRLPGRQALPAIMVIYAAVFPGLVIASTWLEQRTESYPLILARAVTVVTIVLILIRITDHLACKGIIGGFPEDEEDDGPLRLGLTRS